MLTSVSEKKKASRATRKNGVEYKDSSRVRAYRFGLLPPVEGREAVLKDMNLAQMVYNDLVAIENSRRRTYREICGALPELQEARAKEKELLDRLLDAERVAKEERVTTRGRVASLEVRENLKAREAELAVHRELMRPLYKTAALKFKTELVELQERANELSKSAKKCEHNGLFWATTDAIIEAVAQASKTTFFLENVAFRRRFDSDSVYMRMRATPYTTSDIFNSSDNRARIDPVSWTDELKKTRAFKSGRHPAQRSFFTMRVGHGEGATWAKWPILLHRELPAGVVRSAVVHREMIGPRESWYVVILVDVAAKEPTCGSGGVAVRFGWRVTDAGIIAASSMDTNGHRETFIVPESVAGSFRKANDLRSIRDKNFDEAVAKFVVWRQLHSAPEWLSERVRHIKQWRAVGKLAALVRAWKENRFSGDEDMYEALEKWRYHDYHLWLWETSARRYAENLRLTEMRKFAASLAKRYGMVVVCDTPAVVKKDKLSAARKVHPEHEDAVDENRKTSATHEAKSVMKNAFVSREGSVSVVRHAGLTTSCPLCGHEHKAQKLAYDGEFGCLQCRYSRDIWTTALLNMLSRAGYESEVKSIAQRGEDFGVILAVAE